MSGIRSKNTKPELAIRSLLHRSGFRFRLHEKDLPGKPDIVLAKYRVAIFVNGCFWHGHEQCSLFRLPKSRTEFWEEKIGRNIRRDVEKWNKLRQMDWRILIVWECATKGTTKLLDSDLQSRLQEFVKFSTENIRHLRGYVKAQK